MLYTNKQVSNVIFALFTEGLLKVCDKLSNPCSLEETSFSERVYGMFFSISLHLYACVTLRKLDNFDSMCCVPLL